MKRQKPDRATRGTAAEYCAEFDVDPLTIVGWCVYYEDGSYYLSSDFKADSLPDSGVQLVQIYHTRPDGPPGHLFELTLVGDDVYWLPGATRPKRGSWVSDHHHHAIREKAKVRRWH